MSPRTHGGAARELPEGGGTGGSTPGTILVVCTANQCRSPLVAALLERHLGDGGPAVLSAGFRAGGEPVPARGIEVAREAGLDLAGHRSTTITVASAARADLVVTAEREHARALLAADPHLWPRLFTLADAARWWAKNPRPAGVELRRWIDEAGADRDRRALVGASRVDDLEDPMHRSRRVWRRVLRTSDAATAVIAAGVRGVDVRSE